MKSRSYLGHPSSLVPGRKGRNLLVLAVLSLTFQMAAGETTLIDDPLNDLSQWTAVNGGTPTLQTSGFPTVPCMRLGNAVARASLARTISGNWTLAFKALHSSYQRGLRIGVFNDSGTQGYGVLWDSSIVSSYGGQGSVSIRKFSLLAEPVFGNFDTALTPGVASGHSATTGPLAQFELCWNASSHTLSLRVDGVLKGEATDSSFASFSRIYVIGNTHSYFDEVVLHGKLIIEDAFADLSQWTSTSGVAPTLQTSGFPTVPSMRLGNGVARAVLPGSTSGNWTLCFKALHSSYSRGLLVGVFNGSGTEGYGVRWDSSTSGAYDGQGYVNIRKFSLTAEPVFGNAGTALTTAVASGHPATTGPLAEFALSWDAESHTLYLSVDGIPKGQVTDSSFSSFSRIYVIGNTHSYFDDVVFLTEKPPAASEIAAAINLKTLGAKGDGVSDDQPYINQAVLTAISLGKAIYLPPGIYKHSTTIDLSGVNLFGHGYPSALAASNPSQSAVRLSGTGLKIKTCRLTSPNATVRESTPQSGLIHMLGATNFEISDCYMERAASVGIITANAAASHGTISNNWVSNTLADGIHLTGGASNLLVTNNRVRNGGDDFIAVVSYLGGSICSDITISDNDVRFQYHGRGITCVGGNNVTISGNTIEGSHGAGIYVASESSFNTFGCDHVEVLDNVILSPLENSDIGHGAIHLQGRSDYPVGNLTVRGNRITNSGAWGIRILDNARGVEVTGNQITNTARDGIDCQGTDCRDVNVSANALDHIGGYGFYSNTSASQGTLTIQANHFSDIHTIGTETHIDVILLLGGSTWSAVNIRDNDYINPGGYPIERFIECHFPAATVTGNTTNTGKPNYVGP